MIRLKLVRVFQSGSFGPIRVYKRAAAGRCAASDWRSGGTPWLIRRTRQDGQHGRRAGRAAEEQEGTEADQEGAGRALDGERAAASARSAELKAILEALIFASPEPLTPKAIYKLLDTEPKEDVAGGARRAEAGLRAARRAAARRSRRRLSDRHAAGPARMGAPAVPRAHDAEADRAGARDAGGHRLPAADHRRSRSPRSAASTRPAC